MSGPGRGGAGHDRPGQSGPGHGRPDQSGPVGAVVVGAGVSGLAAAHELAGLGELDGVGPVTVVDAAPRVGGKVRTTPFDGLVVDCAADAFLARVPEAVDLCRRLGLGDELVAPATSSAHVLRGGRLLRLPPGLVLGVPTDLDALARSGTVSPAGVARAALDLTLPGRPWGGDEPIGALVRRRLGDEAFEALVAPLLSGVAAGDADRLGVEANAPQLAAAVRHQPSLIAGLRAELARRAPGPGGGPPPAFFGLRPGMEALTAALAAAVVGAGGRVELGTPATAVAARPGGGFRVALAGGGAVEADRVVVATPAGAAARLLAGLAPGVAAGLEEVPYASVVMTTLAFPSASVGRELDGSGFLVPASERLLLTACSWASSKWAHLARPDRVVVRLSTGRVGDERALALPDAELVEALVGELAPVLGLEEGPEAARVDRWPAALPQLGPGHVARARAWAGELAAEHPGLALAGAAIGGIGIPACVRHGVAAARAVAGPHRSGRVPARPDRHERDQSAQGPGADLR